MLVESVISSESRGNESNRNGRHRPSTHSSHKRRGIRLLGMTGVFLLNFKNAIFAKASDPIVSFFGNESIIEHHQHGRQHSNSENTEPDDIRMR